MRAAFGDLVPQTVWTRQKMGFGVPIAGWFRGPLKEMVHDLLLSESSRINEFFRQEVVHRLVTDHESMKQNHAYRLWNLLVLEKWMRRWQ